MKKTAILLAAIMVMSLSMTACNTDKSNDDYDGPDTTVSDTVEDDDEESETDETESEETEETEETEEKSEVNLYENDEFSLELPLGWIENPSVKDAGIAFVAPGTTGENVIITYTKMANNIFAFTQDDFQAQLNKTFGTEVNIVNFGVIDVNGAEVLEVVYNLEKNGKKFSQTYRYQNNGDKTLAFVYTNVGEEITENCEKIYNTLKFKNAGNSDDTENTEDDVNKESANLYENDIFSFDLGDDWKLYSEQGNLVIFMLKKAPENNFATNITVAKESLEGDILSITEDQMVNLLEKTLGVTPEIQEFGTENINGRKVLKSKQSMVFKGVELIQTQYYLVNDNGDIISYTFSNGGTEAFPEAEENFKKIRFK